MNFKWLFLLFFTLIQFQLSAFPISIRDNWFVKQDYDLNFSKDPTSWENFKELSVRSTDIKDLKEKKIIELSFFKQVEISEEDYKRLSESVSILIPYISNAYEIYL